VPDSRLATGRWPVGVCAGLLAAALGLTSLGVVALLDGRRDSAAAEQAAVAAAKDCIAATQAPDLKAMTESQRKIVDCSTENYAPQANLYGSLLTEAYETVQAQVKISDIRAALAQAGMAVRPNATETSGLHGAIWRDGRWDGGADPRREGVAVSAAP
jgi:Mce-associated membrane protein